MARILRRLVWLGRRARKAQLDLRVMLARRVTSARKVFRVPKVRLALRVLRVRKVRRVRRV